MCFFVALVRCARRSQGRHCEPPGRANARPMTGSAKQSIFAVQRQRKNGLLRRFAPLRKRFAFVAGNDDKHKSALSRRDPPELCKNLVPS
jgi:hypothetical protein